MGVLFFVLFIVITSFTFISIAAYRYLKKLGRREDKKMFVIEFLLILIYTGVLGICWLELLFHWAPYDRAIDKVDDGYTPLSARHALTFTIFFILFLIAVMLVWIKGRSLPPLTLVLSLVFLGIGALLSIPVFLQAWTRNDWEGFIQNVPDIPLVITAIMTFSIAILLIIRIIMQSADLSENRTYTNKQLNYLNQKLADTKWQPLWVLLLLFPVFAIITAVLCLFGQSPDSLIKVFTETATWGLSEKVHPPYLDHRGHYLCTVAACGDPKVVKPIRIGKRHGQAIIVNRQLMVANAYEEMIRDYSPRFHRFVRFVYDKYGYGFSKHVNTPHRSNLTYLAMKPLEWLFLLKLYLLCCEPEEKIRRQYTVS